MPRSIDPTMDAVVAPHGLPPAPNRGLPAPPPNIAHPVTSEREVMGEENFEEGNIQYTGERPNFKSIASEDSEGLIQYGGSDELPKREIQPDYGSNDFQKLETPGNPSDMGHTDSQPPDMTEKKPALRNLESGVEGHPQSAPPTLQDVLISGPPPLPSSSVPPLVQQKATPPPVPSNQFNASESKQSANPFNSGAPLPPAPIPAQPPKQKPASVSETPSSIPAQQQNQNHVAVPVNKGQEEGEKSAVEKCMDMIEKTCLIVPIRYFAIFGGAVFIITMFIDFATDKVLFLDVVVNLYLLIAGVLIIAVESPRMRLNRRIQSVVFEWMKFMERLWGRALFYMVLGLLSFSDFGSPMKVIAGLYAILLACCMLYISRTARNKLLRIDVFVSQGAEGQQRIAFIEAKYDELNTMNGLTIDEVIKVAEQAGRTLARSEANAILQFFDEFKELTIMKDDWIRGFKMIDNGIRLL